MKNLVSETETPSTLSNNSTVDEIADDEVVVQEIEKARFVSVLEKLVNVNRRLGPRFHRVCNTNTTSPIRMVPKNALTNRSGSLIEP